jgi:iron complex outermembrane receptor protein
MRKAVLMASVAIATMNLSPAWAEEAGAPAAEDGVTADSGGLADIVVTAQRRSESLQKVPVVVTAVEPEVLEARNVSTLQDLPKLTPSLTVQNQASNVTPFIRGVGSTVTGAGQAASVATYVDGVYIATLTSAAFDLDNVEQVQVLEGPQGALYGRNATGGAIVVTTKTPRPGDPISGRFRAGYGNYNNREASGIVSGGLGEMFAFSVNGSIRKRDGYIKNLNAPGAGTSNADFYDRDSKSIGAVLVFKPSEQFNLVLRAQHFESDDRSGQGYQAVGLDLNVLGTGLNGSQLYYAGFLQSFGVSPADAFAAAAICASAVNMARLTKTRPTDRPAAYCGRGRRAPSFSSMPKPIRRKPRSISGRSK